MLQMFFEHFVALVFQKDSKLRAATETVARNDNRQNISREITICNIPLVSLIELHPFNGQQIMTILTLYDIKLNLGTSITHYV